MEYISVLNRVPERHPDVSKEDAATAWRNRLASAPAFEKEPGRHIAIGVDGKGRLLELVAVQKGLNAWLVIHAQCPPQNDIRQRLGLKGRKHGR